MTTTGVAAELLRRFENDELAAMAPHGAKWRG